MPISPRSSRLRNRRSSYSPRRFERLEQRTVLTNVTTPLQLIEAIDVANSSGGSNTITLAANINLFQINNFNDGPNGLPVITPGDNLTIVGKGHTIQRSAASSTSDFRLFDIASGGSLTLKSMTLKNGLVSESNGDSIQGGAIFVESNGQLALSAVTLTGNSVNNEGSFLLSTLQGGAIYNAGTTKLSSSSIRGNSATYTLSNTATNGNNQEDNASISDEGNRNGNGRIGNVIVQGGGIYNTGSLTITASSVLKNSATSNVINGSNNPPGGIGSGNSNGDGDSGSGDGNTNGNGLVGDLTIDGGGLYNAGTASLKTVSFSGNSASSQVINGSDNGNGNGMGDGGDNNGDNNGNGLEGNVTVAGGAIYNYNSLTANTITVILNFAASTVINGSNNGNNNGVDTEDFNGNNNGNGVDGSITVSGGGIANDGAGTASIELSVVSGNYAASSITNGNNNGDGNGQNNAGLGNNEGKNNGNGVVDTVHVSGGGIDNDTGGSLMITATFVFDNAIKNNVTNGNTTGNSNGNNDGDGDGLADDLTVHGGGIHNAGTLTVTSSVISANTITDTIHNGNGDGNNCGDNNAESGDGRANGNCVTGDVLEAGGGIANSGMLTVNKSVLAGNLLKSMIANGNNNGNNDGQSDGANNNCGINCGNGVGGDVELDGGGIGNSGTATITSSSILANFTTSTITNGKNDGVADGGGSPASTGADGQGDGNGVNGNVEVIGGGTNNATAGSLTLISTTVAGNYIHSSPAIGQGDTTLDGVLVNGTVTVSGANSF